MKWLPCGVYHEHYPQDHAWWQTKFVRVKMLLVGVVIFVVFPYLDLVAPDFGPYFLSVMVILIYTILAAMGVQLLIGFCGQLTLGHAAFVAVGAYTAALVLMHGPEFAAVGDTGSPFLGILSATCRGLIKVGLLYPVAIVLAGVVAGLWCVLFGLPSARVKGFYLIMTTIAAQWITVEFFITQYVSQIGGRAQAFSVMPDNFAIGPFTIDSDKKVYFLGVVLILLLTAAMANLLRSKPGRAWIAIRDNDIAAEAMGVNIVVYKLLAFFVAGAMGGVAGVFWLNFNNIVSPEHFQWFWSLWWVGVILIGGVGSMHGTIFGSMFMVLVLEGLKYALIPLGGTFPELLDKFLFIKEALFGLAIALFLIYEPNGLAYRWWQLKNYF
ncbi:MAG: branched-chain amino acid ABC transporter permease, partial [Thermodesulfobacteriota bacterium]